VKTQNHAFCSLKKVESKIKCFEKKATDLKEKLQKKRFTKNMEEHVIFSYYSPVFTKKSFVVNDTFLQHETIKSTAPLPAVNSNFFMRQPWMNAHVALTNHFIVAIIRKRNVNMVVELRGVD